MLLRWGVGLVFVAASLHKIHNPAAFAQIVYGYDVFPVATINLIAIVMPFIEFTTGLALIAGVYPRAAAAIVNALLVSFALVITFNLLRGHEFDCGCFPTFINRLYADSPVIMLVRNLILLACSLPVMRYRHRRRGVVLKTAGI
jgi:uncharacterized membrane protein YphA (DoxX/SURF4 family)